MRSYVRSYDHKSSHRALACRMKNRFIWSAIDIFGTVFFKNTIGWVCKLSESPRYQQASPYQEYNTISESYWYLGDETLLCHFKEMQVTRNFLLHKRCYKLRISSGKSLNTFTFWSSHLILFEFTLHLFGYFTSPYLQEVWRIKNLGSFSICMFFRKFISAKISPNKTQVQCCNWFGLVYHCVSTIPAVGVLLNSISNRRMAKKNDNKKKNVVAKKIVEGRFPVIWRP